MSLSMCVLGSGSSGNCTVVVCPRPRPRNSNGVADAASRVVLIDAGLSPRQTGKRLGPLGLTLADVSDIVLTHFDTDHFNPGWIKGMRTHEITAHFHQRHRNEAARRGMTMHRGTMFADSFELHDAIQFEPIMLAHDANGTAGFIIEHESVRVGFATDLGRVTRELLDRFRGLHALAMESNYDRDLQVTSHRPRFLKKRIMGGSGHLSNEESIDAVMRIAEQSALAHVVLLHLSRQCNDPRIIKRLYGRRAPHLIDRLTITSQYQPTPMLHVKADDANVVTASAETAWRPGEQLALF